MAACSNALNLKLESKRHTQRTAGANLLNYLRGLKVQVIMTEQDCETVLVGGAVEYLRGDKCYGRTVTRNVMVRDIQLLANDRMEPFEGHARHQPL